MSDNVKESLRKMIGAMWIEVNLGDVYVKQQLVNPLIVQTENLLRYDLESCRTPVENFRTKLHDTVQTVLRNYYQLPINNPGREKEIEKIMGIFKRALSYSDNKIDEETAKEMDLLYAIEACEYCLNLCLVCNENYSRTLSGDASGLTVLQNVQGEILHTLGPVITKYNLADISMSDFKTGIAATVNAINARSGANTTGGKP